MSASLPPLVGGFNFTVPPTWEASPSGPVAAISPPITAQVSFTAGAAGSTLARDLTFTITGTAKTGVAYATSEKLAVSATVIACDTTAPTLNLPSNQTVEATAPSGRVKRPGTCYRVDVVFTGGQRLSANFQLK